MKNHVVQMEFPPAAYALLLSIAIEGGHVTVPQMIHALVVQEARAFAQALASEVTPELSELFAATQS